MADLNKLTQKSQEALQAAQTLAVRYGHQEVDAEHLLLALLGRRTASCRACSSAWRCRSRTLRAEVERAIERKPKVSGAVEAGKIYVTPELQQVLVARRGRGQAAQGRVRLGRAPAARRCSTTGRLAPSARLLRAVRRRRATASSPALHAGARQPARDQRQPRGRLRGAREVRRRPGGAGAARQARPGDRPRRRDPPRGPHPVAQDQEQPGADRRAGRRQDRDRRGPGAAHRARRRARVAQGPQRLLARHGRAARRRQVPRRVRGAPEGGAQRDQAERGPRSSSSSTSCTPSSAPARPRARPTPATCSSRCSRAASCTASAPPRSTSTASTSRRTPRSSGASSR